jgi:hypothetical protein
MALADPFPHPPQKAGKYQVRIFRDKDLKALLIFAACYAARHFVDLCLKDQKWDYVGDHRLEADDGHILIWSEQLHEIMDHKMTQEEAAWELPRPYPNYAHMVLDGTWSDSKEVKAEPEPHPAPATKHEKTPKSSRDGLISIGQIATELRLDPREARAILRKKNIEKPTAGWAWSEEEVLAIKKLLTS